MARVMRIMLRVRSPSAEVEETATTEKTAKTEKTEDENAATKCVECFRKV